MRATEGFWANKVVALANDLAKRVGSYPKRGFIKNQDGKLSVDVMDMHDFLLKVRDAVDELEDLKSAETRAENPDQLTLF